MNLLQLVEANLDARATDDEVEISYARINPEFEQAEWGAKGKKSYGNIRPDGRWGAWHGLENSDKKIADDFFKRHQDEIISLAQNAIAQVFVNVNVDSEEGPFKFKHISKEDIFKALKVRAVNQYNNLRYFIWTVQECGYHLTKDEIKEVYRIAQRQKIVNKIAHHENELKYHKELLADHDSMSSFLSAHPNARRPDPDAVRLLQKFETNNMTQDDVIKAILKLYKDRGGSDKIMIMPIIKMFREHGHNFPEFNAIEKSIKANKK